MFTSLGTNNLFKCFVITTTLLLHTSTSVLCSIFPRTAINPTLLHLSWGSRIVQKRYGRPNGTTKGCIIGYSFATYNFIVSIVFVLLLTNQPEIYFTGLLET